MNNIKRIQIIIVYFIFSMTGLCQAAEVRFVEPLLLSWSGNVSISDSHDRKIANKKNLQLREKVTIKTGEKSFALIALTKNEKIFIGPESEILLPVISWEDGSVERIEIVQGKLRLINLTSQPRLVMSPLSRDSYAEVDALFEYDDRSGKVTVSVLQGALLFRGLENEDYTRIEKTEKISFTGDRDKGEFLFDVLLQGKKIARGKLSEKTKFDSTSSKDWWNQLNEIQKKLIQEASRQKKIKKAQGVICSKPEGKLDQCSWTCLNNPKKEKLNCLVRLEGVSCVRKRCNANGEWSDDFILPSTQSKCQAKPIIGTCDY